jgi:transcriptional regulator with PAS, ATPase and Fis domain
MADDKIIYENDINFNSPKRITAFLSDEISLKEYTQKIINHFLGKYDNDVLLVAKKLKIGKSTIYRMLKENNIPQV